MRLRRTAAKMLLAGWAAALPFAAAAEVMRVASVNLCTDQMLLLLADPEQILSLSPFATSPTASVMAAEAEGYPRNNGSAEALYRLAPDLVLASTWTSRATVAMLTRFGVEVAEFAPEISLDAYEANLLRVAELIGQAERGEAVVGAFRARRAEVAAERAALEALWAEAGVARPRIVSYAQQGWSAGVNSLEGMILAEAGYQNLAEELGLPWGGLIALETMIEADPDRIAVAGRRGAEEVGRRGGWSEAQALLAHPALRQSRAWQAGPITTGRDWACATPQVLETISELIAAERARLEEAR